MKQLLAFIPLDRARARSAFWIPKNGEPYQEVDIADIEQELIDRVWYLYRQAYKFDGENFLAKGCFQFLKYNKWILLTDTNDTICAFIFINDNKNHFGCKIGLVGADVENKDAKSALVRFVIKAFNIEGVYGEVSDRVREIVEGSVPEVPSGTAALVLNPKKITPVPKSNAYIRLIKNLGEREKLMVGRPVNTQT